jgi:molybdopterin converting factor small subunit
MTIPVQLWSYFRDLAGTARLEVELAAGATIAQLLDAVYARHPELAGLRNSTLIAVGVDYQRPDYVLRAGDEVSLFPPVQGG